MQYPFLDNNEFILFDYLPGSSGQLLLRLWSELDTKIYTDYEDILVDYTLSDHPASREVMYNVYVPKRYFNWYFDKCQPDTIEEQLAFFELLGTQLVAQSQRWNWKTKNKKFFYFDDNYKLENTRILYCIHTMGINIDFSKLTKLKPNLKFISIVPQTARGLDYQVNRCSACYPGKDSYTGAYIFNNQQKNTTIFDFQTCLVDKDTDKILRWLKRSIGDTYDESAEEKCIEILNTYYKEIVDNV